MLKINQSINWKLDHMLRKAIVYDIKHCLCSYITTVYDNGYVWEGENIKGYRFFNTL